MYLHLGADIAVRNKEIIGIFDLENATVKKSTKDYLAKAEKEKRVINVSYDMPKSFCICEKEGKVLVFISPISCATLFKRIKEGPSI